MPLELTASVAGTVGFAAQPGVTVDPADSRRWIATLFDDRDWRLRQTKTRLRRRVVSPIGRQAAARWRLLHL